MGRKHAEKPLAVLISFRIDQETADALEVELTARKTPGMVLSKHDLGRMLLTERLQELRARARKPASKK